MKDKLGNGGKKGKKDVGTTLSRRERGSQKIAQESGEEDEVQPEIQLRKLEPSPIPSVGPEPMLPAAQTPGLHPAAVTRESAHHRAAHHPRSARDPRATR